MQLSSKFHLYNPIHFFATGCGVGLIPFAPGTMGTLLAVPIFWFLPQMSLLHYGAMLVLLFGIGCWLCDITMQALNHYDHPSIVFDEIVGFLVTMMGAPKNWIIILCGFVLFRIFDIWKPWPIRTVDKKMRNGCGIMLDDLLAAIYAGIILRIIIWI